MAAMSDREHEATGLELLLPDPEFIAQLGQKRLGQNGRPDQDDGHDSEFDDYFPPPYAA